MQKFLYSSKYCWNHCMECWECALYHSSMAKAGFNCY